MQGEANTHLKTVTMPSLVWVLFLGKTSKYLYVGVQNKYCAVYEQDVGKSMNVLGIRLGRHHQ